MSKRRDDGVGVACATYRIANKKVSRQLLKKRPTFTRFPKQDLDEVIERTEEKYEERMIKFYRLGLVRGIKKTLQLIENETITYDDIDFDIPEEIEIKVKLKFKGKEWESKNFSIECDEIIE